jgi:hypothetical protein
MLKVHSVRDEGPDRRLFEIQDEGVPASEQTLGRIVFVAAHLLEENQLPGEFRVAGEGLLSLDLSAVDRSFSPDGILFAALDVFNDPMKNPTLSTRLRLDDL